MENSLKEKILKIYEIVNNGGTDGEKQAAKYLLDKILLKYNLEESVLKDLALTEYSFTYATTLEQYLLLRIVGSLTIVDPMQARKRTLLCGANYSLIRVKHICIKMTYLDWVTVDSAYEYFRRHMKAQYKIACAPIVARCRTIKTKNAKRKELENPFFIKYCIVSNLVKDGELTKRKITDRKELAAQRLVDNIEGGSYNRQLLSNLLLNN